MGFRTWLRKQISDTPDARTTSSKQMDDATLFAIHKYETDGVFDYEAYREAQVKKASNDTGDVWADPKTLDMIAGHAKSHIPDCKFIICHGSKSGMESNHLAKQLNCKGVGTDIAPPGSAQGVVEWDFHEPNEDWRGKASVVYTNALDHSYDPKKALDNWVDQLAPGGLIYIEHTALHGPSGASASDPFGADVMIMPYLILQWAEGAYFVREIIKTPHKKPHWKPTDGVREDTDLDIWVFVVGRNDTHKTKKSPPARS